VAKEMHETEPCRKKENMGKWEEKKEDREEFKDHAGQEEVS
jgi:hypothetical protein